MLQFFRRKPEPVQKRDSKPREDVEICLVCPSPLTEDDMDQDDGLCRLCRMTLHGMLSAEGR